MYLLGVLVFIMLTIFIAFSSAVSLGTLIDLTSLLLILLITIPVILLSGYGRDFAKAFKFTMVKGNETTLQELKRAQEAVALAMKTIMYSGVFGTLLGFIVFLRNMNDPASLGPSIIVSTITILYAIILNIILLPVKARLNGIIIAYLHE